jgi:hypothetical protein
MLVAAPARLNKPVHLMIPEEAAEILRGAAAMEQRSMQDLAAELILEGLQAREAGRGEEYPRAPCKRRLAR